MIEGSIARRYARALFALGDEQALLITLLRETQRAADVWQGSAELQATLGNPRVEHRVRRAIWDEVIVKLGVSAVAKSFFSLLFDKGRLAYLPAIAREFSSYVDKKENRLRAELISATPLDDEIATRIKSALQRRTGKVVILARREDPELISGVVTKVGDMLYDGSLKTQLARMKEAMLGHG